MLFRQANTTIPTLSAVIYIIPQFITFVNLSNEGLLPSRKEIIVLRSEIWTSVIRRAHKAIHLVLIHIYLALIALKIIIINIIRAIIAARFSHFQQLPPHILSHQPPLKQFLPRNPHPPRKDTIPQPTATTAARREEYAQAMNCGFPRP